MLPICNFIVCARAEKQNLKFYINYSGICSQSKCIN